MPVRKRQRLCAASLAAALLSGVAVSATAAESPKGDIAAGRAIAMDRAQGNCIACHVLPGGDSPGAIGPALVAMKSRFPSKEALAKQIWDPTVRNPDTVMPPFGRHAILSEKEFNDVVDYIWSL